jgi:hypothetical protein
VGFLDKAKKLAEQAKGKAEEAYSEVKTRTDQVRQQQQQNQQAQQQGAPAGAGDPKFGTAYMPGMLGRPGWRERGLIDPAALLPIKERDRLGVPHSTKSQILEEPYGMGRRWTAAGRSAAVFWQLYPEHQNWQPPAPPAPLAGVEGAYSVTMPDGKTLVFMRTPDDQRAVLELTGFDPATQSALASSMHGELSEL